MTMQHEFALYYPALTSLIGTKKAPQELILDDQNLVHRMGRVLRLRVEDSLVFFDETIHVQCRVQSIEKKRCVVVLVRKQSHDQLKPHITVLLPLLKREALESALYSCVELGANAVQLVSTEKIHRAWRGEKELQRARSVMIAAAEQSKNFALPTLLEPITLEKACQAAYDSRIFFEPHGKFLSEVAHDLRTQSPKRIAVLVGPEADLSDAEKELVRAASFSLCALTPTVLRARQAVAVGLGAIRSLIR